MIARKAAAAIAIAALVLPGLALAQIPPRFRGLWHSADAICDGEDAERFRLTANAIDRYEQDTEILRVRVKGPDMRVSARTGLAPDLVRTVIRFHLQPGGKTMLIDGQPYHLCPDG